MIPNGDCFAMVSYFFASKQKKKKKKRKVERNNKGPCPGMFWMRKRQLVNFLKVVFFQFVVLFFCALFLNLAESCPAIGVDRRKKVWSWSGRGSFIDGTLVVCFLVRISQRFQ